MMEENTDVDLLAYYTERIHYMEQFLLCERFEKLQQVVAQRTRYMTVCLENTFHPQNASAVVRTAEAFGVQQLYAVESLTQFSPHLHIVRGTDQWVDIRRFSGRGDQPTRQLIDHLRNQGYRIVATTPHQQDTTPAEFDVERGKFALFFGTEHAGISDLVMHEADEFLRIPMYGFVESLNLSACAAILMQQLIEKMRTSNIAWQLSATEQAEILFRWVMTSVKDSENILKRKFKP